MNKTIYDYHILFGITTGAYYHAFDYACQVCDKSFELYEKANTEEEKRQHWEIAKMTAMHINAPIPIDMPYRK